MCGEPCSINHCSGKTLFYFHLFSFMINAAIYFTFADILGLCFTVMDRQKHRHSEKMQMWLESFKSKLHVFLWVQYRGAETNRLYGRLWVDYWTVIMAALHEVYEVRCKRKQQITLPFWDWCAVQHYSMISCRLFFDRTCVLVLKRLKIEDWKVSHLI